MKGIIIITDIIPSVSVDLHVVATPKCVSSFDCRVNRMLQCSVILSVVCVFRPRKVKCDKKAVTVPIKLGLHSDKEVIVILSSACTKCVCLCVCVCVCVSVCVCVRVSETKTGMSKYN